MKWWEIVLICTWPASMGIALMLGWVKGHKAGVEFAHAQMIGRDDVIPPVRGVVHQPNDE